MGFAAGFCGSGIVFSQLGLLGGGFNWWAMFIFLPAVGSLNAAWTAFRRNDGVFTAGVRSSLGGGLIVLTVAVLLLFDMDWSIWWPLMLIMPGFSIFLNGMVGFGTQDRSSGLWVLRMGIWTGVAVMLLGWIFLLDYLGMFSLRETFNGFGWWGVVVLTPGFRRVVQRAADYTGNRPSERGCDKPGCGGLFGLRGGSCGDFWPGMEPVDAHYTDRGRQHAVGVRLYPEVIWFHEKDRKKTSHFIEIVLLA